MRILLILLFVAGCNADKKLISIQGKTMGTYYKVTTYGTDSPAELKKDIDTFLKFFNKIFSTYIPDSEISKINNSKFENIKMSDSFKKIMELSNIISKKSRGYFDVTVGPLVNAWGFGPQGKQRIPTDAEVKSLLDNVGYNKVQIKDNRLHRKKGILLDLSAIAKGFGVDELVKFLEFRGFSSMLVEIGGEVRSRGQKPDGVNWRVGIEGPSEKLGTKIIKVVDLKNQSMATSGSYRNYLKYGDRVFNHTIDPKTGYPTKHRTVSVSVVAEYCSDADAWATALMGMGVEKGLELSNQNDISALFQVVVDGKIEIIRSKEFEKL